MASRNVATCEHPVAYTNVNYTGLKEGFASVASVMMPISRRKQGEHELIIRIMIGAQALG